eukprot:2402333-Alexandrium_andersonii.AAC.1
MAKAIAEQRVADAKEEEQVLAKQWQDRLLNVRAWNCNGAARPWILALARRVVEARARGAVGTARDELHARRVVFVVVVVVAVVGVVGP